MLALAVLLVAATPAPEPSEALLARPGWALRAAVDAIAEDELERAERLLRDVAARHAIVADHAELLLVGLLAVGDDPAAAAERAREAVARHAKSPLAPRLHTALGDALLAAGDEAGARSAWEVALVQSERAEARARLLLALAESRERAGEPEAAARAYLELWRDQPLAPEARRAEARLAELEPTLAAPLRLPADHHARGDRLRAAGHNEAAITAYDAALAGSLSRRERRRVLAGRAQSLFSLRRYPEAIAAFEELAPDPDSLVSRARAIARAGDVPRAIAELEALAGGGHGLASVYARYLAALLLEDEDELARARTHFEAVARESAHPRYANPALWYLGWTAWRQGDAVEARKRFADLAGRTGDDPIGQLRARYWEARAAERQGDGPAATAGFGALAREYPITYYGWRAAQRAGAALPASAGDGAQPPASGRRALKPAALARARILLEAGLADEAALELERSTSEVGGLQDRLDLARLLADAGQFHRAQGLIVGAYQVTLARGVIPGLEELWWLAWPSAYASLIRELSPEGTTIDPALVSAVMREESGYRPAVTSPAGARGLLQIMPETGERLAAALSLPGFTPDDLYRPRTNIQLGSFYLDQLARQFDGRLEATIASYNAGPQAAARWNEEQPGLEDDEWVEAVPYSETREYVKRVLRSVHAYRALY